LLPTIHALVREGMPRFVVFRKESRWSASRDGMEAIKRARELRPDVVLMDISMPTLGGLEATLELRRTDPDIKILVLTQYDDREYIARFLKAGVSGYLLKKAVGTELVNAIRAVHRGECYLFSAIASEVVSGYLCKDKKDAEPDLTSVSLNVRNRC
jgi:DNA-binding NarL/FixJ family response regulator